MGGDQCQNLQLFLFTKIICRWNSTYKWHTISHLYCEVLHTNDTLSFAWMVKFYIQMISLHANEHIQMEVLNEKLYSIQMEEKFYMYKWAFKLRKFYIQMRSSTYKWDTNDTLSITWWICYTANHNTSHVPSPTHVLFLYAIALSSIVIWG